MSDYNERRPHVTAYCQTCPYFVTRFRDTFDEAYASARGALAEHVRDRHASHSEVKGATT
jgi:hypothetical protein